VASTVYKLSVSSSAFVGNRVGQAGAQGVNALIYASGAVRTQVGPPSVRREGSRVVSWQASRGGQRLKDRGVGCGV
jgi:hypothetical protein